MPITVISDIHGQTFWKGAAARNGDQLVFLGDYFDLRGEGPHADSQIANFLEIVDLAKNRPGTVLLLGNHDIQYMPGSRFGTSSYDNLFGKEFGRVLALNNKILRMAHVVRPKGGKPVVFSHAGVSRVWMERRGIERPEGIDAFWRAHPEEFDWQMGNPFGDDPDQSPAWIRPRALAACALDGYVQVVGHTVVDKAARIGAPHGDIWLTCTLNGEVLRLDDDGSFLKIVPETANGAA